MEPDTHEAVRAFLAKLPGDEENTPPGTIAIFKHTVEEFGGDNAAVYDWVQKHGGVVKATPGPRLGAGRSQEMRGYLRDPTRSPRQSISGR